MQIVYKIDEILTTIKVILFYSLIYICCPLNYRFVKQHEITAIQELLATRKRIVIVTHKNPDGDAMGSSLGLYNFLIRKKHQVTVITPNGYPDFLHWLPENNKVLRFDLNPEQAEAKIKKADILFCLDFNSFRRIGDLGVLVKKAKAIKILIDHHLQPEKIFNFMLSDKRASSTSQLVFDFIAMLDEKKLINKKVANCLYCGIMTDTLNFRINTTTAHTHAVAAELIENGAQNAIAYMNVFDTNTENRVRLLGYSLSQKMKVFKEFNTAFISLSANDLKQFDYQKGDTEGLVNYPLSIEGIIFSVFFVEMKNEIKISLRSKGNFDVNEFSRKHFNGGGHMNASGGELHTTLDEALTQFIQLLPDYKDQLLK